MGFRMSKIADARAQLVDALRAAMPDVRVHAVTPNRPDSPCVWVGAASVDRISVGSPGAILSVVGFGVYVVADGRPDQQTLSLDDGIAAVWDAVLSIGWTPIDATPTPIDVGGPSLRGALVRVEHTLSALTLCAPTLTGAANG